jgi:hypothetical protein
VTGPEPGDPPRTPSSAFTARRRAVTGFVRAIERPHALRDSVVLLVGLGAAYAFAIELLALGGGHPGTAPWLRIPRQSYFAVEVVFTAPVIVFSALLASVLAYLLAKAGGSRATFDDTLVVLARATFIATLFTLVPDLLMGVLTTVGPLDGAQLARDLVRPSPARIILWTYLSLYVLAFLALYPTALRASDRQLPIKVTVAAGWTAFAVYQGVLLVFIR